MGRIECLDGKNASVIFGDMRTKMPASRLEYVDDAENKKRLQILFIISVERRAKPLIIANLIFIKILMCAVCVVTKR